MSRSGTGGAEARPRETRPGATWLRVPARSSSSPRDATGTIAAVEPARRRRAGLLAGLVVALTAANLRTSISGVGPVLPEISAQLHMSAAAVGALASLPMVCFAVAGSTASAAARRLGLAGALAGALYLLAAGTLLRAVADGTASFLAASVLAFAGVAICNVLLPALVKAVFPRQVGMLTAIYTTALAVGASSSAALAVPIATAATTTGEGASPHGWRVAVAVWAAPALAAAVLWHRADLQTSAHRPSRRRSRRPSKHRHARRLAFAAYFGAQSGQAFIAMAFLAPLYRDAGASPSTAGALVAAVAAISAPVSLAVPAIAARMRTQRPVVLGLAACYSIAYAGLLVDPLGGAWVWAVLLGLGAGTFPLAMTLFALGTDTAEEAAALSSFGQSVGYAGAAAAPLLFGWAHARAGWQGFVVLFALLTVQLLSGLRLTRHSASASTGPAPDRNDHTRDSAATALTDSVLCTGGTTAGPPTRSAP